MSSDGYDEIKDDGPDKDTRRVETATKAAKHAAKNMTEVNYHIGVGIYHMGWGHCTSAIGEKHFKAHADENAYQQLQEDVGVPSDDDGFETSQEMMSDGFDCIRQSWEMFSHAGRVQVVSPICSFLNNFAKDFLSQSRLEGPADEGTRLKQQAKRTSYGSMYQPSDSDNSDNDESDSNAHDRKHDLDRNPFQS